MFITNTHFDSGSSHIFKTGIFFLFLIIGKSTREIDDDEIKCFCRYKDESRDAMTRYLSN